jgi:DNA-binding XRE family transcriptional regulator
MARNSHIKRRREHNKRLQALRINEGLSRDDLARRTGVSRESIRLAEHGFTPGPRIQFAIADAFKLRPLDIWPLERQRAAA